MNSGVLKRGDRWVARPYVHGRHVWLGTFATKREAQQAAAAEIARLAPRRGSVTIAELAELWHERHVVTLAPATRELYRTAASSLCRQFGSWPVERVTYLDLSRWALDSPGGYVTSVRSMFRWAVTRAGLLDTDPSQGVVGRPPKRRHEVTILTAAQVRHLADTARTALADSGEIAETVAAMIVVAAATGMRPGELFGLKWADIGVDTISVRRSVDARGGEKLPKNGRERVIALTADAREALSSLPRHGEYVFVANLRQRFVKTTFDYWWRAVRRDSGLGRFRFYDLRHTCATRLLEQGLPSYIVAVQLGHSDNGALVERTYGHPSVEAALERIREADSVARRSQGAEDVA